MRHVMKNLPQSIIHSVNPDWWGVDDWGSEERPIPNDLCLFYEAGFGADLRDIRIHTGRQAALASNITGARAFAIGNHIFFADQQFSPNTEAGRRLLAHELAHCLQQRAALDHDGSAVAHPEHHYEQEAWLAADAVLRGDRVPRLTPDPSGCIRRAITIVPGSAKLVVTQRPTVLAPVVNGANMVFGSNPIRATGEVSLNGNPGENASGWRAGFIQAQWIETNWSYYRGQHNNDGSIFLQRARAPARPNQACRDTVGPVADIFYNALAGQGGIANPPVATAFPVKLNFSFFDQPSDSCPLTQVNTLTTKTNYLREAQFEFHFCTVLTVRDPGGAFHHLKAVYWNLHWQARFQPSNFAALASPWTITLIPGGNSANVGGIIDGTPTDRRFTGVLTSAQTQSCNQVFQAATANPNRRESRVWENFDVRR